MSVTDIWPAFALTSVALLSAKLAAAWITLPPVLPGRLQTLDGLRGFMAFFVFLHHTVIWYFYVRTGKWDFPPSNLYTHFGQSSVAIFFMITGFLFYSKVLDARSGSIDWLRLYVSRVLRLTPLYLFLVVLLALTCAYVSDFAIREPITSLLVKTFQWITFNVLGTPDLNGIDKTFTMIAGVTWSLRYEWLFYCSLPLLAVLHRIRTPTPILIMALLALSGAIAGFMFDRLKVIHLLAFSGGIVAVHVARSPVLQKHLQGSIAALAAIACLATSVTLFRFAETPIPLLLLSTFFVVIACGNTLGGLLTSVPARIMGEISYSIYLLHGLMLFVVFELLLGHSTVAMLSPLLHWSIAAACTPALILLTSVTFKYIEAPPIIHTNGLTTSIRSRLERSRMDRKKIEVGN